MQMALPHFRALPSETRARQRERVVAAVQSPDRPRVVVAVAFALAVLAAAPAFALRHEIVDFWSAEPAPGPIQLDFDRQKEATGTGSWHPVGTAREVLRVYADGEARPLWVVPSESGAYCWRWHHIGSCAERDRPMRLAVFGRDAAEGGGSAIVVGDVLDRMIQEIQVEYEDGVRSPVRYVWVSEPIDAGFFAVEVPEAQRVPGHRAAYMLGLDDEGQVVERVRLPLSPA